MNAADKLGEQLELNIITGSLHRLSMSGLDEAPLYYKSALPT